MSTMKRSLKFSAQMLATNFAESQIGGKSTASSWSNAPWSAYSVVERTIEQVNCWMYAFARDTAMEPPHRPVGSAPQA